MGLLDILGPFGGILKVSGSRTRVDSTVFQLHYRWTTTMFFIAAGLVATSEFMGDPIKCVFVDDDYPKKAITTYCWISSTYTINTTGPHKELTGIGNNHNKERKYHAYYQWVPFVLFGMGCLFYFPHMVWKRWEGKLVHNLLQGLHKFSLFEDSEEKIQQIVKYMNASEGYNNHYFTWYMICEMMNLVNVVFNMFLMDKFVGGEFWEYGLKAISFINTTDDDRDDPMKYAFPRITMCTFWSVGKSGSPENREFLCILPQNMMNEKVFLFFWLWMMILTTVTVGWIVWRIVVLLYPAFRLKLVDHALNKDASVGQHIQLMHLGDFCLLEVLSKNLDIDTFKDVIKGIAKKHADGRVGSVSGPGGYIGYRNDDA